MFPWPNVIVRYTRDFIMLVAVYLNSMVPIEFLDII
jgi:hypothetical protein